MQRRLIVILAIVTMIFSLFCVSASAISTKEGNITIKIDAPKSVNEGDEFTVVVTFEGENLGRVDGQLKYDSSLISYISGGTSAGDNGYIELKEAGIGEPIKFNLKFKGVAGGKSNLNLSTNGIYNLEEEYISSPALAATVEVASEEVDEETNEETTNTVSDNNTSDNDKMGTLTPVIVGLIIAIVIIAGAVLAYLRHSNRKGRHSKG